MVRLYSRAGVPVWRRPSLKPADRKEADKPDEGDSSMRPAGNRLRPLRPVSYNHRVGLIYSTDVDLPG